MLRLFGLFSSACRSSASRGGRGFRSSFILAAATDDGSENAEHHREGENLLHVCCLIPPVFGPPDGQAVSPNPVSGTRRWIIIDN